MHILVTGSEGTIGQAVVPVLRRGGHDVSTLDRVGAAEHGHANGDLRDPDVVRAAVAGNDAVIHLGGIASDRRGAEADVLDVNVRGTWNVLLAAHDAGVRRVVHFSSINALGCVGGYGRPTYLPVDDDHPHRPASAYQLSKHLGEQICRALVRMSDSLTAICLRPVLVADPTRHYAEWATENPAQREARFESELYAYIDVRDVADATVRALTAPVAGFEAILLTAADTTAHRPTRQVLQHEFADIRWVADGAATNNPDSYAPLVDGRKAERILGFVPQHSWRDTASNRGR